MANEPPGNWGSRSEKRDEKQEEKVDEKHHEKSWDEKWGRDGVATFTWAAILIWGGIVLLLGNLGILFTRSDTNWGIFWLGAGAIIMLQALFRRLVPQYRQPVRGSLIVSLVFLGIGLGFVVGWNWVWPIVLIVVGLAILVGFINRRRS